MARCIENLARPFWPRTILSVLTMTLCAPALAQSTSRPTEDQVREIIARLQSADPAQRDIAQHKLSLMGTEAIPLLEQSIKNVQEQEIQTRLQAVLQTIESSPSTTLVTLNLKEATGREAIELLAKVSGIPISVDRPIAVRRLNEARVSIEVKNEPFWSVLRQICEISDLRPDSRAPQTQPALQLTDVDGHWCRQFTCVDGPYAISALSLSKDEHVNFGKIGNPQPPDVRLHLIIYAEHAAGIQSIPGVAITRCVDEHDNSVSLDVEQTPRLVGSPMPFQTASVRLHPGPASHTLQLVGEAHLLQGQLAARVEFADFAKTANQIRVADGMRFRLHEVAEVGVIEWTFKILLPRDGRTNLEMRELVDRLRSTTPRVEDAMGRPLDSRAGPTVEEFDEGTEFSASFVRINHGRGVPTDPVKLVWDLPAGPAKGINVPFKFIDLPLP